MSSSLSINKASSKLPYEILKEMEEEFNTMETSLQKIEDSILRNEFTIQAKITKDLLNESTRIMEATKIFFIYIIFLQKILTK